MNKQPIVAKETSIPNKLFDPSSYEFTIRNYEQQKHLPFVGDV
jgi:hypothetical protein